MSEKMTAVERLEDQLNERDAKIEDLEGKVEELQRLLEASKSGWTLHVDLGKAPQTLPVPRLEMFYIQDDPNWYDFRVVQRLVYQHMLGHYEAIPIGQTRTQGGHGRAPIYDNKISLPFREGCHVAHNAAAMNLPAFAVLGDRVEAIKPRRPGDE